MSDTNIDYLESKIKLKEEAGLPDEAQHYSDMLKLYKEMLARDKGK